MKRLPWLLAALICVLIVIASKLALVPGPFGALFGPLVILCIIGWILPFIRPNKKFGWAIAVALLLSFCADVAIQYSFIAGLALFLLAQIAYIVAFIRRITLHNFVRTAIVCGIIALVVFLYIAPGAQSQGLFWPVLIYCACIAAMSANAWAAALTMRRFPYTQAAVGAGLFMISDALIGITKFAHDITGSSLMILVTYWLAQALIASVLWPQPRRSTRLRNSL